MYKINMQITGNDAKYPEDFPMLQEGNKVFAMVKDGDDFIIQTTINDNNRLINLIESGEKELNKPQRKGMYFILR